jgi:Uma2 family endonuclease
MTKIATPPISASSNQDLVPPLEDGDRLTRAEFERRYNAMPHLQKAELIEGVVHVTSAVRFVQHGAPHFDLIGWLALYRIATTGVRGGDNTSLRLDLDNEPQPDAFLIIMPEYRGRVQIDANGYVTGSPELIAEVTASSSSYDLHDKLTAYRRNGVREYVVWRVYENAIDWFVLRDSRYEPLPLSEEGYYKSEVFPGLWLDPAALMSGDMVAVARVAQRGIGTPEHASFQAQLQQAASK